MSSSDQFIQIPNTSPLITYGNVWDSLAASDNIFQTGNLGQPMSPSLKTVSSNGTFSFNFDGTYAAIYGSYLPASSATNTSALNVQCIIDNVTLTPDIPQFPQNNWPLCQSGDLLAGSHTLTFAVDIESQTTSFFFDYLLFTPSFHNQTSAALVRIDPSDPSITLTGNWTTANDTGSSPLTNSEGASLNVSFTGQGLTLYGVYSTLFPFASSQAEYSIDGSPATKFLLSGLVNSGPSTAALFNQILLTASFPHGFHEMTVRYLGNEQQTGLGIGFITIHNSSVLGFHQIQPTTTIMSTGLSPTQNSTTSPISHVTVSTVTDIPNAHTSPTHSQFTSSTPANSHKTRDILIAITIAASITAFFLIIAIIIIFLRKLHKSQGNNRVSRREPYVQVMSSPTLNLTTELPSPIAREQQTLRTGTSDSLDYAFSGGLPMIPTPSSRGVSFQSFEPLMSPRITSPVSPILQVRSLPTMAFSETVQARRSSLPMLLEAPVFAEAESVPPTRRNSEVLHLVSVDDSLNVINLDPQVPAIRPLPNPPVISSAANPVASREAEMPDSNVTNIIFTGGESREQTGPGPRNAKKIHMDSGIRLGKNHILQYKDPSTKSSNGGLPPVYTRS